MEDLEKFIAGPDITLVEAMRRIDKNVRGILFIVDEQRRLIGSLTDGDIRRCIIRTGSVEHMVSEAMLTRTRFFTIGESEDPYRYMERMTISALPLLDTEGKIIDIYFRERLEDDEIDRKALADVPVVIMAGGQGTRLYPYTQILPKALIPIREKTISEHIIDSFRKFGSDRFCFILNHKKNMIKAYFNELSRDYTVDYVEEEKVLGTGGGVALLRGKIDKPFILTNCDILINEDLGKIYRYHKEKENLITMVCSVKDYILPYGVVHIEENGGIQSMEEKPKFSFLVNTGCYVVEPEVIERIPQDTCIGFPDVIEECRKSGEKVGIYPISENAWTDIGTMDLLEEAITRNENV